MLSKIQTSANYVGRESNLESCKQNRSNRYVAEALRMSLRDISIVLKKQDLLKQDRKDDDTYSRWYVSFTFLKVVAQKDDDVIF